MKGKDCIPELDLDQFGMSYVVRELTKHGRFRKPPTEGKSLPLKKRDKSGSKINSIEVMNSIGDSYKPTDKTSFDSVFDIPLSCALLYQPLLDESISSEQSHKCSHPNCDVEFDCYFQNDTIRIVGKRFIIGFVCPNHPGSHKYCYQHLLDYFVQTIQDRKSPIHCPGIIHYGIETNHQLSESELCSGQICCNFVFPLQFLYNFFNNLFPTEVERLVDIGYSVSSLVSTMYGQALDSYWELYRNNHENIYLVQCPKCQHKIPIDRSSRLQRVPLCIFCPVCETRSKQNNEDGAEEEESLVEPPFCSCCGDIYSNETMAYHLNNCIREYHHNWLYNNHDFIERLPSKRGGSRCYLWSPKSI